MTSGPSIGSLWGTRFQPSAKYLHTLTNTSVNRKNAGGKQTTLVVVVSIFYQNYPSEIDKGSCSRSLNEKSRHAASGLSVFEKWLSEEEKACLTTAFVSICFAPTHKKLRIPHPHPTPHGS